MKVLHIISSLGSGGAEKLVEEAVPLMNKIEDIRVDVLLLTDKNNVFNKNLAEHGIKVDIVPLKKPRNPINIYYIRKYIIEGEYDIVHAHLFPTIYWTSIASKLIFKQKPKFFMTEHSTHNRRRERSYLRYLERFIYFSYGKIISVSQQTKNNLISWIRPKQNKLNKFVVINNGINIEKFRDALPYKKSEICSEFTEDIKLICMIGRFSKAKDQPTLIKAMRNLPKKVHLLLVGEGPLKEENENLAKKIGVSDRVHFLGFRKDVERILKTVDILVLSSNWEGFGLVAVEGMAAGTPVIASDIDGLRETVGGVGMLFQSGNEIELINKINYLLKDVDKRKEKTKRGIAKANSYNIYTLVEEYTRLYKQAVEK